MRSSQCILTVVAAIISLMLTPSTAMAYPAMATCYGEEHRGGITASGDVFDPDAFTAAHPDYEMGTQLLVTNAGVSIPVTVTDRGPYGGGADIDLSCGAMNALGLPGGVYPVELTVL